MRKKTDPADDTMEFPEPSPTEDSTTSAKRPKRHRKTKAALAAGAVASTVAATAAYRRRHARHHLGSAHRPNPMEHRFDTAPSGAQSGGFRAGPDAGLGATQPL